LAPQAGVGQRTQLAGWCQQQSVSRSRCTQRASDWVCCLEANTNRREDQGSSFHDSLVGERTGTSDEEGVKGQMCCLFACFCFLLCFLHKGSFLACFGEKGVPCGTGHCSFMQVQGRHTNTEPTDLPILPKTAPLGTTLDHGISRMAWG
jgi:hypothetical protein